VGHKAKSFQKMGNKRGESGKSRTYQGFSASKAGGGAAHAQEGVCVYIRENENIE